MILKVTKYIVTIVGNIVYLIVTMFLPYCCNIFYNGVVNNSCKWTSFFRNGAKNFFFELWRVI